MVETDAAFTLSALTFVGDSVVLLNVTVIVLGCVVLGAFLLHGFNSISSASFTSLFLLWVPKESKQKETLKY